MEASRPKPWHVQMLAELRVTGVSGSIDRFPTQMTGGLLALLALTPGIAHTREALIETFWPGADIASGRNRLNLAVSWLRGQLEPSEVARGSILEADRRTVRLSAEAVSTDVAAFDTACADAARATAPTERLSILHRAIALYTGELLPGFYDTWAMQERERLLSAFLTALNQAAALHAQGREYDESLALLERALAVDPLREEAHEELVRVLVAADRAAAAVRQYQALERLLEQEYDTTPSPEITALIDQVRAKPAPSRSASEPRPASAVLPLPPLPRTLTRFFGREEEIEQVRTLLCGPAATARLVTLVGPGGSGKTRLALESAHALQRDCVLTAAFVPLADSSDPHAVPAHVADALRLPQSGSNPLERIEAALADRPLLLVLDNAEHILSGVASLAHTLLERLPYLLLLVTSRQRLDVSGEQEIAVPPLPTLPETVPLTADTLLATPSVQLFLDRARSVRRSFALNDQNAEAVASLCAKLEGIPLAIELCAAWAGTLTPAQMRDKLERRFDLLVSRRNDIPARHRTLHAAMEYSFVLLPDSLRPVFRSLSVFRGGCTLEAVEAVCPDLPSPDDLKASSLSALNALAELSARSLIFTETEEGSESSGDVMRYRMLETIREFAAEQFVYREAQECRRAHAAYFLTLAEKAESNLFGPDQEIWLNRLDRDQENLRAALEWDRSTGDFTHGLRLAGALHQYWYVRGYLKEGADWLDTLVTGAAKATEDQSLPETVAAKAWSALGHLRWCLGEYTAARTAHERALEINRRRGDQTGIARSLNYLGITYFRQLELEAAEVLLQESLDVATTAEDRSGIARALTNLGNVAQSRKQYDVSRNLYEKSLDIFRELGDRQRMADTLNNIGISALFVHDYSRAKQFLDETLSIRRDLKDRFGESIALAYQGVIQRRLGNLAQADAIFLAGLRLAHEIGNRYAIAHYLVELGLLAAERSDWEHAVFLISAGLHLSDRIGANHIAVATEEYERTLATSQDHLSLDSYRDAESRGRSLPLAQVIAQALTPPA